MTTSLAYINGDITTLEEAKLPLMDRSVFFGDGVYDTLFSINGRLHASERHFRRLAKSIDEISITGVDIAEIQDALDRMIKQCNWNKIDFYIQVSRGSQPMRSHTWNEEPRPTLIIIANERHDLPAEYYQEGVKLFSHADLRWGRCDIKSVNLLPNIMARQIATSAGGYDALLIRDGYVTEGAGCSVLTVKNGALYAPPLTHEILPGVTREIVIELARNADIPVLLERRTLEQHCHADEAIVLSTKAGVLPIRSIDGQQLLSDRPIIHRLTELYRQTITALECVK